MSNLSSVLIDQSLNNSAHSFFLDSATVGLSIHWVGFAMSCLINSCFYFDIIEDAGLLYMFVRSYTSITTPTRRQTLVHACALLWGIRLLSFVGYRVIKRGQDFRFDKLIKSPAYNLFGWTSGGTWCWLNCFCVWTLAGNTFDTQDLTVLDCLGLCLFATGLFIETVSDVQKYQFNADVSSGKHKKWISHGLWKWSRHPNYFGEITVWLGLAIVCVGGNNSVYFTRFTNDFRVAPLFIIFISPLFSCFFLVFTSLMLLEKYANQKWENSAQWIKYKRKTPVLFPNRLPTWSEVVLQKEVS